MAHTVQNTKNDDLEKDLLTTPTGHHGAGIFKSSSVRVKRPGTGPIFTAPDTGTQGPKISDMKKPLEINPKTWKGLDATTMVKRLSTLLAHEAVKATNLDNKDPEIVLKK